MSDMIAKLEKLQEWLREPDHSEAFSLEDVIAWINRRPTHIIPSVIANLSQPPLAAHPCSDADRFRKPSPGGICRPQFRGAVMSAPDANGWMPISTAPHGELMLYEPDHNAGRNVLPARIVIERWPTHYPRQATHWQYVPRPPVVTP